VVGNYNSGMQLYSSSRQLQNNSAQLYSGSRQLHNSGVQLYYSSKKFDSISTLGSHVGLIGG
jgi:X-X-X-Leu-X-X-Gly heptad repeat protein